MNSSDTNLARIEIKGMAIIWFLFIKKSSSSIDVTLIYETLSDNKTCLVAAENLAEYGTFKFQ